MEWPTLEKKRMRVEKLDRKRSCGVLCVGCEEPIKKE